MDLDYQNVLLCIHTYIYTYVHTYIHICMIGPLAIRSLLLGAKTSEISRLLLWLINEQINPSQC